MATTPGSDRISEDGIARLRLEMALEARRFEISLFWQRSLFFWGFNTAALLALGSSTFGSRPELALSATCFGFICSLTWTLANRGSKYWHESWERKVEQEELRVVGALYSEVEELDRKGVWLSARRYSVSRLAMALADYVFFLWVCLLAYHAAAALKWTAASAPYRQVGLAAFLAITAAFAVAIVVKGRSGQTRSE